MSSNTKIQWTETTWNPVAGCSKVSAGCENCYAITVANGLEKRFKSEKYAGLTKKLSNGQLNWTREVKLISEILKQPLHWKKPRKVFVNSMSDLFHEKVPFEFVDRIYATMYLCFEHTFQILTKRPERALGFYKINANLKPLPNVWFGVSAENQQTADERIPILLDTPAVVKWISAEPLLGEIDLSLFLYEREIHNENKTVTNKFNKLDWVVVGGESGKNARECKIEWIEKIVNECLKAKVPVFVKQLGSVLAKKMNLKDKKGGDINEFPDYLQIRQFPK